LAVLSQILIPDRIDARGTYNRSCSESIELVGQRQSSLSDTLRLSFADHVHHFNPAQDCSSAAHGLEAEHRLDPPFDGTVILLNPIV
jgi:hypothetical protein